MEKEVSEAEKKLLIRQKYIDNINYDLSKKYLDSNDLLNNLRGFFSEFLKLDYEFTYEELTLEVKKLFINEEIQKKIENMLYTLSEIEFFRTEEITQEEIRKFLNDLKELIENSIPGVKNKKESFLEKIFKSKKPEEINKKNREIPKFELSNNQNLEKTKNVELNTIPNIRVEETNSIINENNNIDFILIRIKIENAYFENSKNNKDAAKKSYLEALEIYNKLQVDNKKQIYTELHELFKSLKK